jgi:hypothetical protein
VTPKWEDIERRCNQQIADQLTILEQHGLPQDEAEFSRGQIAAYRDVLAQKPTHKESDLTAPSYA